MPTRNPTPRQPPPPQDADHLNKVNSRLSTAVRQNRTNSRGRRRQASKRTQSTPIQTQPLGRTEKPQQETQWFNRRKGTSPKRWQPVEKGRAKRLSQDLAVRERRHRRGETTGRRHHREATENAVDQPYFANPKNGPKAPIAESTPAADPPQHHLKKKEKKWSGGGGRRAAPPPRRLRPLEFLFAQIARERERESIQQMHVIIEF